MSWVYVLSGALVGLGGMSCLFYQILENQARTSPLLGELGSRIWAQACDPPNRCCCCRNRERCRRAARFPLHSNGVRCWFRTPAAVSNHSMICSGVSGCCPLRIHCIDSGVITGNGTYSVYRILLRALTWLNQSNAIDFLNRTMFGMRCQPDCRNPVDIWWSQRLTAWSLWVF